MPLLGSSRRGRRVGRQCDRREVLHTSLSAAERMVVSTMPTSFLLDRSGVTREKLQGFKAEERKSIRARVVALLRALTASGLGNAAPHPTRVAPCHVASPDRRIGRKKRQIKHGMSDATPAEQEAWK